ncbi:hypothetical protein OK016_22160 [Vibrio chagasii]|nr:hypothetical protein [Vibrio chagasii]
MKNFSTVMSPMSPWLMKMVLLFKRRRVLMLSQLTMHQFQVTLAYSVDVKTAQSPQAKSSCLPGTDVDGDILNRHLNLTAGDNAIGNV